MSEKSLETKLEVMCSKVDAIKEDIHEIKQKLESKYITVEQFEPVKKIVYGLVTLVMIAVITAIVSGVLK